jgi:glycosyltransferase involved in cell wall biosynthesis
MTRLDFSIVVPVFNAAKYIERCLRALLLQTYPPDRYEIIVVDNNSQDGSAATASSFGRVTLLREAEQGSYAARNRGIRAASGEVVAFTDPDCEPREDWLEQIHRAMAGGQTGVILGDRRFATDSGIVGMLAAYESALGFHIFSARRVECYYAYTNNMAVRLPVLKALNGFQHLQRGADTLLLRQTIERYGPAVLRFAPEAVVRHLEIAGIRDYLRKKCIYGRLCGNRTLATALSVPLAKRLELARCVKPEQGRSLATNLGFLGALAAGAGCFAWERRWGGR